MNRFISHFSCYPQFLKVAKESGKNVDDILYVDFTYYKPLSIIVEGIKIEMWFKDWTHVEKIFPTSYLTYDNTEENKDTS